MKTLREEHAIDKPVLVFSVVTRCQGHEELEKMSIPAVPKSAIPQDLKEQGEKLLNESAE